MLDTHRQPRIAKTLRLPTTCRLLGGGSSSGPRGHCGTQLDALKRPWLSRLLPRVGPAEPASQCVPRREPGNEDDENEKMCIARRPRADAGDEERRYFVSRDDMSSRFVSGRVLHGLAGGLVQLPLQGIARQRSGDGSWVKTNCGNCWNSCRTPCSWCAGRHARVRQPAGGEAARLYGGRTGPPASRKARAGAISRPACGTLRGVFRRSRRAPDGQPPGTLRALPGRPRSPRRYQPGPRGNGQRPAGGGHPPRCFPPQAGRVGFARCAGGSAAAQRAADRGKRLSPRGNPKHASTSRSWWARVRRCGSPCSRSSKWPTPTPTS